MRKVVLLAFSISLFSCSKKDSEDSPATIFTTWREYSSKTVEIYYKDGAIVKKDSIIIYGKPKDSWSFTKDGKLIIYDEESNHTCNTTFTQMGDSITINAGECSDKYSSHVNLAIPGELKLNYMSTLYYGSDSTQYITEVKLLQ